MRRTFWRDGYRLEPGVPMARLFVDPCERCERAYAQVVRNGHIGSIITCPVCARRSLRP